MIRIIKEKTITPLSLALPENNEQFLQVRQPNTQKNIKVIPGPLRVFMYQETHKMLWKHSLVDLQNEVGGALIGFYARDPKSKQEFILITDILNQPPEYYSDPTELRFTTQFYDDLENYMDQLQQTQPNLLRLGLYHTHPGYGVFMSRIDKNTFKGIFKATWQIALISDPVKQEDGVFFKKNKDISACSGYCIFQTKNPKFQLHQAETSNPLIAKYNKQFSLKAGIEAIPDTPKKVSSSVKNTSTNRPEISIQLNKNREKIKQTELLARRKLKLTADAIPSMCFLFDMRYKNTAVPLRRYFKPLLINYEVMEYPYMVFMHRKIQQTLNKITTIKKETEVFALLKGRKHYDKLKELHFVDIFDILPYRNSKNKKPVDFISQIIKKVRERGETNVFGWLYLSAKPPSTAYHYFARHKQLFSDDSALGIMPAIDKNGEVNLEDSVMVAHNFDKNVPFDYFKHLFLYEKPF